LPDVRFRVMGWGPQEEKIRRSAPPNVEVHHGQAGAGGETLRRALAAARIFFLPTRAETFGLALVEAMASGCAVISSAGLPFEGAHIDPDDRDGMIRAVKRLWSDPEGSVRMGRRNIALAQQYSWENYTNRLLATYSQVLHGD
jgi:glycosyltransferase involved in cell wall biosynthesis